MTVLKETKALELHDLQVHIQNESGDWIPLKTYNVQITMNGQELFPGRQSHLDAYQWWYDHCRKDNDAALKNIQIVAPYHDTLSPLVAKLVVLTNQLQSINAKWTPGDDVDDFKLRAREFNSKHDEVISAWKQVAMVVKLRMSQGDPILTGAYVDYVPVWIEDRL